MESLSSTILTGRSIRQGQNFFCNLIQPRKTSFGNPFMFTLQKSEAPKISGSRNKGQESKKKQATKEYLEHDRQ